MSGEVMRRPEPGGVVTGNQGKYAPHELDADLGQVQLARELVRLLGRPSRINRTFSVRYGIWRALNHIPPTYDKDGVMTDPGNPTGYDCSPRILLYDMVSENSVNEEGWYGEKLFAYLMHPKLVLQGVNMREEEEEKESLLSRAGQFLLGRKKGTSQNGG